VARLSSVVVRASEAAAPAAPKGKAAPKAPWVQPTLDENTPSPIFGGSTGGLLRKAQVGVCFKRGATLECAPQPPRV
jgi:hypothetical protein